MRWTLTASICFLMASTFAAAASEFVVIAADNGGKAYPPGAVIKAGSKVALAAGARITLLAQSGEVVTLKGPYEGAVKSTTRGGAKGALAAITKLMTSPDKSKTVGATRVAANQSGSAPRTPPADIWVVEADRAGRACSRADQLIMWRPGSDAETTIGVWHKSGPPKRMVWPGRTEQITLARDLIEADMQLSVISGGRSLSVILSVLPPGAESKASGKLLQWFAARGCSYQARKLVNRLHAAAR